jgi:hypothetical protein
MNETMLIECQVDFPRARTTVDASAAPGVATLTGRVPRIAKLLALAIKLDRLVRDGVVEDFADLARLAHVTRARMSQVMCLVHLAPDIQGEILFWPRVQRGKDPVVLRDLLPITRQFEWSRQRRLWNAVVERARGKMI